MRRIERFSLLRAEDNSDPRAADSQLISDGQVTSVRVPGIEILHQFDTCAGYLLVTDHDCPFEEIFHFMLLDRHLRIRSHRSLGAGAKLLDAAEAWAREKKCTGMSVRSNVIRERAHAFYERQGYQHIKTQKAFRKSL